MDSVDFVRLRDVAHYCLIGDIIYLGMIYENKEMIENFCEGLKLKKV